MIHKMEREPKRGIPARPAKVNAAEDIIERIVSVSIFHDFVDRNLDRICIFPNIFDCLKKVAF